MKIENQVCSLELAKRFKEMNVKQKSLFFWNEGHWPEPCVIQPFFMGSIGVLPPGENYSAFTVAELGEMLPSFIKVKGHVLALVHYVSYHGYGEFAGSIYGPKEKAKTEADARAKMLIYLIEKDLVKP